MPANRTRAAPRPRSTRIAPYERIADIEAPHRDAPKLATSKSTTSRPIARATTASRPTTSRPTTSKPSTTTSVPVATSASARLLQTTDAAPQERSSDLLSLANPEQAALLTRLAVKWAASRRLSLLLFHSDVAASFERHTGLQTTPKEVVRWLRSVEEYWSKSSEFRESPSDLAQAAKLWMRDIRDVEELDLRKADLERRDVLADEGSWAALNVRSREEQRTQGPSGIRSGDNDVDVTSDEIGDIAQPEDEPLQVRRPNDASGEGDKDEEYDSDDDDSDSYDSDDAREHSNTLLLHLLALVAMQKW